MSGQVWVCDACYDALCDEQGVGCIPLLICASPPYAGRCVCCGGEGDNAMSERYLESKQDRSTWQNGAVSAT